MTTKWCVPAFHQGSILVCTKNEQKRALAAIFISVVNETPLRKTWLRQQSVRAVRASISQSTNKREDNPEPKGAIFSKKGISMLFTT